MDSLAEEEKKVEETVENIDLEEQVEEQEAEEETSTEDTCEATDESEETEQEDTKKKGPKKKKKSKEQEKIEELTDRVQRQMAEFDNFRKRTEKEKSQMYEVGAKSIIEKILPVVDNFERGLATVSEELKDDPFAEGMDKVYKQLMTALDELGVKEIEAEGKEFDPNLHNAVMHIDDENLGENVVAQVLQKGYTYRDSVVRHSMVQVAN
ncbi:nucleotide exchange factor GrpE [Eubacterium oxidoreducens]|uniref:Protein GrpE n=1 Tax=Eubacterium oxidoreducens TaxID=1732 RepID=A0A1G6BGC2_EUBOX|nr:molecular chaperone GrpE [Eubacterium oxidoreducens]